MAYLKNKVLFFTTSPRSPEKMIPELQILDENFKGQKWTKKTQAEYTGLLAESQCFKGKGSSEYTDFSARDRITRAPKALGFVDLKPVIQLTDSGKSFVYGKRPQEVFLRQLLKFQLPSPFHIEKNIEGTFFVKPYLEILRLIRDLDYLSFDELKVFAIKMTDYHQYDDIKKSILDFRKDKATHKGEYNEFLNEMWTISIMDIYAEEIAEGKTKTRESKDDSLKKFLKTKKSNARDYADACFRYLRFTGLIALSHKERSVSIFSDKLTEVDFILKTVDRNPVYINDLAKYKEYLFNSLTPKLYIDNIDNVKDQLMRISDYTLRQLSNSSLEELKDIRDSVVAEHKKAVIDAQIEEIKSYALYSEIIDTFNEIISNGYYDTPLMLEYNTWRAMTMLDHGIIKGNFKFDDTGKPLSTASGNLPDIECDYGDFVVSVEVTMQRGQRQYENEGEPVARHYGQLKKRTGKDTYCIFVAPVVNNACLAHFYALNQIGISYYGGKTKIVPLDLDQFMTLVEHSYNYPTTPNKTQIRQLLDNILYQEILSDNENDWNERIQSCVKNWLSSEEIDNLFV